MISIVIIKVIIIISSSKAMEHLDLIIFIMYKM